MATTQDIIDRAMARSEQNESGLISTADMVDIVSDAQKTVYMLAAQEAPNFFGQDGSTSVRSTYTADWDISNLRAGVITRVEIKTITGAVTGLAAGDKINLIDLRFPELEVAPRAHIRNQKIKGYGTDLGAADANMVTQLTIYYSYVPGSLTDENSIISLPERWIEMLVLPLARKLAVADGGRQPEVQAYEAEMATETARFIAAISTYDYTAVRPATARSPLQILGIPKPEGE